MILNIGQAIILVCNVSKNSFHRSDEGSETLCCSVRTVTHVESSCHIMYTLLCDYVTSLVLEISLAYPFLPLLNQHKQELDPLCPDWVILYKRRNEKMEIRNEGVGNEKQSSYLDRESGEHG